MSETCLLCLSTISEGGKEKKISTLVKLVRGDESLQDDEIDSCVVLCPECDELIDSATDTCHSLSQFQINLKTGIESIRNIILETEEYTLGIIENKKVWLRKLFLVLSDETLNYDVKSNAVFEMVQMKMVAEAEEVVNAAGMEFEDVEVFDVDADVQEIVNGVQQENVPELENIIETPRLEMDRHCFLCLSPHFGESKELPFASLLELVQGGDYTDCVGDLDNQESVVICSECEITVDSVTSLYNSIPELTLKAESEITDVREIILGAEYKSDEASEYILRMRQSLINLDERLINDDQEPVNDERLPIKPEESENEVEHVDSNNIEVVAEKNEDENSLKHAANEEQQRLRCSKRTRSDYNIDDPDEPNLEDSEEEHTNSNKKRKIQKREKLKHSKDPESKRVDRPRRSANTVKYVFDDEEADNKDNEDEVFNDDEKLINVDQEQVNDECLPIKLKEFENEADDEDINNLRVVAENDEDEDSLKLVANEEQKPLRRSNRTRSDYNFDPNDPGDSEEGEHANSNEKKKIQKRQKLKHSKYPESKRVSRLRRSANIVKYVFDDNEDDVFNDDEDEKLINVDQEQVNDECLPIKLKEFENKGDDKDINNLVAENDEDEDEHAANEELEQQPLRRPKRTRSDYNFDNNPNNPGEKPNLDSEEGEHPNSNEKRKIQRQRKSIYPKRPTTPTSKRVSRPRRSANTVKYVFDDVEDEKLINDQRLPIKPEEFENEGEDVDSNNKECVAENYEDRNSLKDSDNEDQQSLRRSTRTRSDYNNNPNDPCEEPNLEDSEEREHTNSNIIQKRRKLKYPKRRESKRVSRLRRSANTVKYVFDDEEDEELINDQRLPIKPEKFENEAEDVDYNNIECVAENNEDENSLKDSDNEEKQPLRRPKRTRSDYNFDNSPNDPGEKPNLEDSKEGEHANSSEGKRVSRLRRSANTVKYAFDDEDDNEGDDDEDEKSVKLTPKPQRIRKKPIKRIVPCPVCGKLYKKKMRLNVHLFAKHETKDKTFSCSKSSCGKKFTLKLNLERHMELHKVEEKKPLVCDFCDSRYATRSKLDAHMKCHNGYPCPSCDIKCVEHSTLSRHIRENHTSTEKWPFECSFCKERFTNSCKRNYHIEKVHEKKKHPCNKCDAIFDTSIGLKGHVYRTHESKLRVMCKDCGKLCATKIVLQRHQIHCYAKKPLVCDDCKIPFSNVHDLNKHKLNHARIKNYECDKCDAKFLTNGELNTHSIRHSGERPFVCASCGKTFKIPSQLKIHTKNIHSKNRKRVISSPESTVTRVIPLRSMSPPRRVLRRRSQDQN